MHFIRWHKYMKKLVIGGMFNYIAITFQKPVVIMIKRRNMTIFRRTLFNER